jgi:peroxiredoxin (alkyl hydroperoxide reductase subunit C)
MERTLVQMENKFMLGVGSKFPPFSLLATVGIEPGKSFQTITDTDYPDRWKVYFFWPKDFTFVCPTEISSFGELNGEFEKRGAQVLGGSTDSEFVHLAWRQQHPDLKSLPFPMLADVKRELTSALGILDPQEGVAQRATFIADKHRIIRFVSVTDLSVGRNPQEVLRVLDALQTEQLTPCGWKPGDAVLKVSV